MIRNHVRLTLRNIGRHKGYSFINVAGLSIGLAAFVLIMLFVRSELSYDRHLEHGDDIYRVLLSADVMGQSIVTTSTPAPMAATLMDEYPEVESAVRVDDFPTVLVSHDDRSFQEEAFYLADSTYLEMFSIPLVAGDPKTALTRPNTIVISEEAAGRYFGDENPLGRILNVDNARDYEVTGVMRLPNANTHFTAELVGSFVTSGDANSTAWLNNSWYTYVILAPGTVAADLEAKFEALVLKYAAPEVARVMGQSWEEARAAGLRYEFLLEPVPDIYLHSRAVDQIGPTGDIRYIYIMSAIALFVLTIACINFMNLSTARAASRAREVGMRKVMGSERGQLVRQFLGESVAMSTIGGVLAVGLIYLALPGFNRLAGTSIVPGSEAILFLAVAAVVTGLLAGVYPAFVLSGFRPVAVLKGSFASSSSGTRLRRVLVVFQFAISIALLIGTGVIVQQLRFIQDRDLGFDEEQVVVLPIESQGADGVDAFREALTAHPAIVSASGSNGLPGPNHIHQNTVYRGENADPEDVFLSAGIEVSHDYVETLGLRIIAGRDFSRDHRTDESAFIINEAAAREIGREPSELIGTSLAQVGGNEDDSDRIGTVVGVFADAHFESLHEPIRPVVLGMRNWRRYLPVRIDTDRTREALDFLEEKWATFEPGFPFRYYFMDEDFRDFYRQEERLGKIYAWFTGFAIFIACLGLFGLASFVTAQRTKEIGVRKVLGASVSSIVYLLSLEFTRLVLIACAVAFPVAWLAMRSWLQDFAYATEMGWVVFVVSGLAAVVIAWLTVGYQSLRAAVANPVDSLHHE